MEKIDIWQEESVQINQKFKGFFFFVFVQKSVALWNKIFLYSTYFYINYQKKKKKLQQSSKTRSFWNTCFALLLFKIKTEKQICSDDFNLKRFFGVVLLLFSFIIWHSKSFWLFFLHFLTEQGWFYDLLE